MACLAHQAAFSQFRHECEHRAVHHVSDPPPFDFGIHMMKMQQTEVGWSFAAEPAPTLLYSSDQTSIRGDVPRLVSEHSNIFCRVHWFVF
jgi:hypothetical protein